MNIEKLEHSSVKVSTTVTVEQFKVALDKAFEKANANVTIPGFRKGKAPRAKFEQVYGVEALYADALDFVYDDLVREIYQNEELAKEIVGKFAPKIETEDFKPLENEFVVSLTFDVYPEVTLGEYKGLEVKAVNTTVTDEEVKNAVEALLAPKAKKEAKEEQVIASGDYAKFDFKGFVNDEAFEGGEATNYELQIGSGQFIPGFEDQMIGMKAGETKDVIVTFPENYGAKDLAGKEAKFVVTVHEVLVNVLPELNDEFVAELKLENVNTVAELNEFKKNELAERKATSEKDRQTNDLIQKLIDGAKVDMPASLVEERVEGLRAQYENQAKMYNIPFDTFLSLIGVTKEQFEDQIKASGANQALFNVVMTKLIEVENLAPSKEELDAEMEKAPNKDQATFAQIYSNMAYNNAVKFLLDNANITE